MDLSSVRGNKLQMRFSHHYKSVDVRVQIKETFLFCSYFSAFSFLFFSIFIPISYFLQIIWHLTPCTMSQCRPVSVYSRTVQTTVLLLK